VASGSAEFFVPGSSSIYADVWQDSIGTVPWSQPVPLNAAGQSEVWTAAPCDVVIKDADGIQVGFVASEAFGGESETAYKTEVISAYFTGHRGVSYDVNIPVALGTVLDRIGASIGLDGKYKESGTTGVVARNVHDVLAGLCLTPYDFNAVGNGTADDTQPLQRALDRASVLGVPLYLGSGIYRITSGITMGSEGHIIGAGKGKSIIRSTSSAFNMLTIATAAGRRAGERFAWSLRDFSIEAPTGTNANNYGITANLDTGPLAGAGATIENVDVTAGLGIDVSGAVNVSLTNCNVIAQQGTTEAVGIDLGARCSATSCIVDGVAFSATHVSTGIKLGFDALAENCYVKNCTVGIECKSACTGAMARHCEMNACGHSLYVRGPRSGAECCDSTSPTVAAWKADAALSSIVSFGNSWDVPMTKLASDFVSTIDGTYSNITGLTLNLVANVTYDIEMALGYTTGNSTGIKVSFAGGTATFGTPVIKPRVIYTTQPTSAVSDADWATAGESPLDTAGPTEGFVTMRHVVTCSAAGTVVIRLAQSAAGATACTVKAGSWARVTVL
jgi:hypothetical protein